VAQGPAICVASLTAANNACGGSVLPTSFAFDEISTTRSVHPSGQEGQERDTERCIERDTIKDTLKETH